MNVIFDNPAGAAPAPIPFPAAHQEPPPPSGVRKRILIVDDCAVIVRTLGRKLQDEGYEVITALDGSSAVNAVRRSKPHLILLDIMFPPDVAHGGGVPWDGFLIMNWLRRMDEAVNVPILIISGGDPSEYEDRCRKAGVAGFFPKPIDHDQLLNAIRAQFSESAAEGKSENARAGAPKVLFVDDENDWRFMAAFYLKDAGYDVSTAGSGAEALASALANRPNLVVLDVKLKGESGLDLMKQLKAKDPSLPILLYSGTDFSRSEVQGLIEQGADGFVRKGTMSELLQAVQQTIKAN